MRTSSHDDEEMLDRFCRESRVKELAARSESV
jgi:hypothetical protein